jgi:diguanylate cyclase (GGDEF)-like protein/PAS domain S-box-containing protein
MYFCTLKIFILSTEKTVAEKIAKLLRTASSPEDCEYQIQTASFGDSCDVGTDGAVIIDRNLDALHAYKKTGNERMVFLASAAEMAQMDSGTLSNLDDLWVVSGNAEHDGSLLSVYFQKLLNTLKVNFDNRRAEICFKTIVDSLPDMVWFKDNDGAHLIVNDEFCSVVEKTKDQIYKRHHNFIWGLPEDDYEHGEGVCRKSEEVVERERKTCQFEEQVSIKDSARKLITYKSPLIDIDGSIFGTCGMGHDTTDLQNTTKELAFIIDTIPFGMAITDVDGKVVTINRFFERFFPNAADCIGKSFDEWNDTLTKEKIGSRQGEEEYRMILGKDEHIVRFRADPMLDIFGQQIGTLHFLRDVTMQYNYEQQNILHANTDFLTGLNNRRSLFDYLTSLDRNSKLSMIMVDLDKFKSVNDTYGHAAGDEALEITSHTLRECFPDGFVARLGGDEFLITLVGEFELAQVEERTQHLLDTLLENFKVKEDFHALSASAGIAQEQMAECDIRRIENLMNRVDNALYTAKESGRARYCVNKDL